MSLLDTLFKEGSGYFFVEEQGSVEENIHYQGIIKTDIAQNTLVQRIKRVVKIKGNQAYSCKVVRDQERYHYYLMKGDREGALPRVVHSHLINFSKEKIKDMHEAYWLVKNNTKDKSKDMIQFLYDKLKIYEDGDRQSTIVREIIDYYVANRKPMNVFHMKSQARLLNCMLSQEYKNVIFNQILQDL